MTEALDADSRRKMKAIEQNWDARTPIHVASEFYARDSRFADFE